VKKLVQIQNLHVNVQGADVLKGVNLEIEVGQVCALLGPNGSGKSSLAFTIMGHPKYKVSSGSIYFDGKNLFELSVDQRAKAGIFLAVQHPYEIEGVTLKDFLRQAYNALYVGTEKELTAKEFQELLHSKMNILQIKPEFVERFINVGFSGGEKKRAEVLQMAVLQPKFIILDEIDSGLDVDALKVVCNKINVIRRESPDTTLLMITHYPRVLEYLVSDVVHVIRDGKIIRSGNMQIVREIETKGYE
jgi:Fe-S cluster assembly ATP-binding protein